MACITTRKIEGTDWTMNLIYCQSVWPWYVALNKGGEYWDHRQYATREEAEAFMADPFADERAANEKKRRAQEKRDLDFAAYYARDYIRISRGRHIKRKAGAS